VIVDAYNTTQNVRGRSDYLSGGRPGDPPPPFTPFDPQRILTRMDAAGVDHAMICSLGQRIENDFIAELVARFPDRFSGYGQVMPQWDDAEEQIAAFAAEPGMVGLKLHPTLHGYHFADHGLLDPIFEACRRHNLIVLVNALDDPFCSPFAIEEIARGFPDVPTLIAHMGAVWNMPEALIVAERHDHLYLETSSTLLADVRKAYGRVGAGKIVMGTEWPGHDFDLERMKIAKAIEDEADRALVEGGNMLRLIAERRPGFGA
jgi:predicted TIM-barrel fold metal-dependent hydrolase